MAESHEIKLPWQTSDQSFVSELKRTCQSVSTLDCSDCSFVTQQAFLQLSREKVHLPNLTLLTMPGSTVFADLVFECLAEMCPNLEEICNINCGNNKISCNQLKCYSNFKNLKVVHDNPVANHGRLNSASKNDKQRRQNWEQDVAKIAINCQKVERYICNGGKGYLDDKSLERIAILMPRLTSLELKRCSISDEGICKFFFLNRTKNLTRLTLDEAGQNITDVSLNMISENCPSLQYIRLMRNDNYTKLALNHLIKSSPHLTDFSFDGRHHSSEGFSKSFDEELMNILSSNCLKLNSFKLYRCDLSFKKVTSFFPHLQVLHMYDCNLNHLSAFLDFLTTLPCLTDLSFVDCSSVKPEFVVDVIIKLSNLYSLTLFCRHKNFFSDVSSLAKEAYTKLAGENGGRFKLSSIKKLSLQGISSSFLRLVTALCSQVIELDFRHTTPISETTIDSEDLVETISSCESLKKLELTSNDLTPYLSDSFFNQISASSIQYFYTNFSLKHISKIVLTKTIKNAPFLQEVTLNMTESDLDERFLKEVVEGCRNMGYVKVIEDAGKKLVRMKFASLID